MQIERKKIWKEDGRYLVYYHFRETATQEQAQAFAAIAAEQPPQGTPTSERGESGTHEEGTPRV